MKIKITRADLLLVIVSFVVAYILCDAGYRVYLYRSLYAQVWDQVAARISPEPTSNSYYQFDFNVGYVYRSNLTATRGHPFFSTFHLNSHGHVSNAEYSVAKPAGEYRIAVLGDSFAATINNNVNWTEIVEEKLNASKAWRDHVNGKTTRVINFAVDGQGFEHFAKVAQHRVPPYQPDLVIVSFITDDFRRRFYYAGNIAIPPARTREEVIEEQVRSALDALPWYSPRPEIALGVIGPKFGVTGRLPVRPTLADLVTASRFFPRSEAVATGAEATRHIRGLFRNALFLVHPQWGELVGSPLPEMAGLLEAVARSAPGLSFVDMSYYLDLPGSQDQLRRWFFIPDDLHYNDHGVRMYGAAVAWLLTTDYLDNGAIAGRGALVSAETIGKSWNGFRVVPQGVAAPEQPVPPPVSAAPERLRLKLSSSKAGATDRPLERKELVYVSYSASESAVRENEPLPKSAASLLGISMPLPEGAKRIRIRATVPLVAQGKTVAVAGIFIGDDPPFAAVQQKVDAAAGKTAVIEIDRTFDVEGGTGALGAVLRVGVAGGGKVFFNGTDRGDSGAVGNPVMVIEVF